MFLNESAPKEESGKRRGGAALDLLLCFRYDSYEPEQVSSPFHVFSIN
jgi:hypothetical protein